MAPTRTAYPIRTLREHSTSLEAAMTLALAEPESEPVHRLRTSTRRIEAQLELLELLPDLPEHGKLAKKARKLLRKLRRAAGSVRDLDVQRKLIDERMSAGVETTPQKAAASKEVAGKESAGKNVARKKRDAPAKKGQSDAAVEVAEKDLAESADKLRRKLKQRRSTEAELLLQVLTVEQRKLAPLLEQLLKALEPAKDLSISTVELGALTRQWYEAKKPKGTEISDKGDLHAIRKSAKLARYIAEGSDKELAGSFEALQESGGTWHDLLTLAGSAKAHLGRKDPLTQVLRGQRDAALAVYQEALGHARGL